MDFMQNMANNQSTCNQQLNYEVPSALPSDEQNGDVAVENNEHLRKIFIGGLSAQTSADSINFYFRRFGQVQDAVVMRDPVSNRSRGFGFVTFFDGDAVERVQQARPHNIDNKCVETKRALPRHESNKMSGQINHSTDTKIFIGGLKDCHDELTIRTYFSQFGKISSIKLLTDRETGRKRGFGFLEFDEMGSADRALAICKHNINSCVVEVKKSTQKPEPARRTRIPVGGAARAGYPPPQPAVVESFSFSSSYNPYVAQMALPPSAYTQGWASYVTPAVGPLYCPPAPYSPWGNFKPLQSEAARKNLKVFECVKPGFKNAQTSTRNDRLQLYESKSMPATPISQKMSSAFKVKREENGEQTVDVAYNAVTAGGGDADVAKLNETNMATAPVFVMNTAVKKPKPATVNRMNPYNNDGPSPAYGI